jgi:hypothetical protein
MIMIFLFMFLFFLPRFLVTFVKVINEMDKLSILLKLNYINQCKNAIKLKVEMIFFYFNYHIVIIIIQKCSNI